MSEREQVKYIIDQMPDSKITRLLVFLKGMQFDDEMEDDLFCENLLESYLKDEDPDKHEAVTLESFAAKEGVLL